MFSKILVISLFITFAYAARRHEKNNHPSPYHYDYDVKDEHGSHYKKEESDGHGTVRGSYGYTGPDGIYREVHYIADHNGFRAHIKTNEPGTADLNPANVLLYSAYKAPEAYIHHDDGHFGQKIVKEKEVETDSYENSEEDDDEDSGRQNNQIESRQGYGWRTFYRIGKKHGGHI